MQWRDQRIILSAFGTLIYTHIHILLEHGMIDVDEKNLHAPSLATLIKHTWILLNKIKLLR